MTSLELESSYPGKIVAGVDEVGRGPLAGPVIAAAVIIDPSIHIDDIKDSKKLSEKKRVSIAEQIRLHYKYAIGESSVAEIDELNILNATKLAMQRSVEALKVRPDIVLADGNMKFDDLRYKSIIKGDNISRSIAAASIIAKVYRDNIMKELSSKYPEYRWEKNAGYGTPIHVAALKEYGPTPYHRSKFIRNIPF